MRAAIYIRVSTEEEKQLNAFAVQREEAKKAVVDNGWTLAKEYLDEGKTGTTTKQRTGYNSLFLDLEEDLFDIIVIKSQDRLMRNVKDWYIFISKMNEHGKRLFMYMENKFYKSDDSLITGIKAILAEEYSRELSKKLLNANATRKSTGKSIITNNSLWGYDQRDGELYINEQEAEVVRRIFDLYVAGYGTRQIKQILDEDGVKSKRNTSIGITTIKRMIHNPLYIGTVVMNKTRYDFDTKRTIQLPEEEWIKHANRVPAIIDKDTFEKANKIIAKRVSASRRGIKCGKHYLSGKIKCGYCGRNYRRTRYKDTVYWICGAYQEFGRQHARDGKIRKLGCDGRIVKESLLISVISELFSVFEVDFTTAMDNVLKCLNDIFSTNETTRIDDKINAIEKKKAVLLDGMLDRIVSREDYARKLKELNSEIDSLKSRRAEYDNCYSVIDSILKQKDEIKQLSSERYISDHIKQISVFEDKLEIQLDIFESLTLPLCPQLSISGHKLKTYYI